MLKSENWWTWERAMEHAAILASSPHNKGRRLRVYKSNFLGLGWTVTYADSREAS